MGEQLPLCQSGVSLVIRQEILNADIVILQLPLPALTAAALWSLVLVLRSFCTCLLHQLLFGLFAFEAVLQSEEVNVEDLIEDGRGTEKSAVQSPGHAVTEYVLTCRHTHTHTHSL